MAIVDTVKAPEQSYTISTVIDLTQPYPQEFLPAAGGGWKVKDHASNSTKLGVLAESVKASPEAQKVKVAIRSNAFNAAV